MEYGREIAHQDVLEGLPYDVVGSELFGDDLDGESPAEVCDEGSFEDSELLFSCEDNPDLATAKGEYQSNLLNNPLLCEKFYEFALEAAYSYQARGKFRLVFMYFTPEDMVQDAWMKIMRNDTEFRGNEENLRALRGMAYSVIRNLCNDRLWMIHHRPLAWQISADAPLSENGESPKTILESIPEESFTEEYEAELRDIYDRLSFLSYRGVPVSELLSLKVQGYTLNEIGEAVGVDHVGSFFRNFRNILKPTIKGDSLSLKEVLGPEQSERTYDSESLRKFLDDCSVVTSLKTGDKLSRILSKMFNPEDQRFHGCGDLTSDESEFLHLCMENLAV